MKRFEGYGVLITAAIREQGGTAREFACDVVGLCPGPRASIAGGA
ncbi:hypothetical protein [Streptomyces sp. NPDC001661]